MCWKTHFGHVAFENIIIIMTIINNNNNNNNNNNTCMTTLQHWCYYAEHMGEQELQICTCSQC